MRRLIAALAFLSLATGAQAGFLEDLFGIAPRPPPSPFIYRDEVEAPRDLVPDRGPRMPPPLEAPPLLQQSTCCKHGEDPMQALLNDRTLMRGDIVMTTDGLRTFIGSRPPHSMRDFVPVGKATSLSAERKKQLLALDR